MPLMMRRRRMKMMKVVVVVGTRNGVSAGKRIKRVSALFILFPTVIFFSRLRSAEAVWAEFSEERERASSDRIKEWK